MQIAFDLHCHIDQRMFGELLDHMIEKADAGRHIISAGAIEIDLNCNRRFGGLALYSSGSHGQSYKRSRG